MLNFKKFRLLIFIATLIQLLLFFLYLINRFTSAESPVVQSDEGFYLQTAVRFFNDFSFNTFWHPGRPIFSWPSVALLKIVHLKCRYFTLTSLNSGFYLLIFFLSIRVIFKYLKVVPTLQYAVFSFLLASPIVFNLSALFLGDLAVTSWSMLFLALTLLPKSEKKKSKAFSLGVVFSLGFLTKPVFLCFGLTILGAYVLAEGITFFQIQSINDKNKRIRDALLGSGIFLVGFLVCASITIPRDYVQLIKELYYNSNTNSYDVSPEQFDRYYQVLWFPYSLFAEFPGLSVVFLLMTGGLGITALLGSLLGTSQGLSVNRLKQLLTEPIGKVSYVFVVLLTYFSFFQHFKNTRETLFLFCLFPIFSVALFSNFFHSRRTEYLALVVTFLGLWNTTSMWGWCSDRVPHAVFNSVFDLRNKSFFQFLPSKPNTPTRPRVNVDVTYKGTKILDALMAIEKNAQLEGIKHEIHVFLPHCSEIYNVTTLAGVYQYSNDFPDVLPGLSHPFSVKMTMSHSTYNKGAFYETGGFPKYFLKGDYILNIENDFDQCFDENPGLSVYNTLIASKISEMDSAYLDGLEKIYEFRIEYGQKLSIYRRKSLPKSISFAKMMIDATKLDPLNMWNYPFLRAAKLSDSSLKVFDGQMEDLKHKLSAGQISYHYWITDAGKKFIDRIIDGSGKQEEMEFPEFLEHLGF